MKKFDELDGYNSILEYCNLILQFVKQLGTDKIDNIDLKSISDPKYEYANAKISTAFQSLVFFQLYEKYGKDIDINKVNHNNILEIIKDIQMESSNRLSVEDKEQIFRNCLAHGRYTLALDEQGVLKVYFFEENCDLKNKQGEYKKIDFVKGSVDYNTFIDLAQTYISVFNLERNPLVANNDFEFPKSLKNLSFEKLSDILLNSVKKLALIMPEGYNGDAIKEFGFAIDKNGNIRKNTLSFDNLDKPFEIIPTQIMPLQDKEKDFFKKYFKFIGKGKLRKLLNTQNIRLKHIVNPSKNIEDRRKKTYHAVKYQDHYELLTNILQSQNGNWCFSYDLMRKHPYVDLSNFLMVLPKVNEINSLEPAATKTHINYLKETYGIDISKLLITRGENIQQTLETFSYLYPILYSNLLLVNAYYAIGYTNEVNNNHSKELFNYKNIDLSGYTPVYDDTSRPSIKTVDPHNDAIRALNIKKEEGRNSKINRIINDLNKARNGFDSIRNLLAKEGYDKLSDLQIFENDLNLFYQELNNEADYDNRAERIEENDYEGTITSNIEFLKNLKDLYPNSKGLQNLLSKKIEFFDNCLKNRKAICDIKEEIEECERKVQETIDEQPYVDSSIFFAHIRNSITHSWFNINYDEMFETGDLSKIKYRIEDFNVQNDQKHKTFEIDLYIEDLIKLINAMKDNVNSKALDQNGIDEKININDIKDEKGIQRYDMTKYDFESHPLPLKRPTSEDFEVKVGDERLKEGLSSNLIDDLKETKEKGKDDE